MYIIFVHRCMGWVSLDCIMCMQKWVLRPLSPVLLHVCVVELAKFFACRNLATIWKQWILFYICNACRKYPQTVCKSSETLPSKNEEYYQDFGKGSTKNGRSSWFLVPIFLKRFHQKMAGWKCKTRSTFKKSGNCFVSSSWFFGNGSYFLASLFGFAESFGKIKRFVMGNRIRQWMGTRPWMALCLACMLDKGHCKGEFTTKKATTRRSIPHEMWNGTNFQCDRRFQMFPPMCDIPMLSSFVG